VEALKGLGAELVQGDLRDRASLAAACQDIRAVISTASSMPFSYVPGENDPQRVDLEGVKDLIDVAKAAGVEHLVYTSFTHLVDLDCPLRNAKRQVEQHLMGSGLTYTILHPGVFMEVWLSPAVGFDAAGATARIYGRATIRSADLVPGRGQLAVASLDNRRRAMPFWSWADQRP